MSLFEQIIKNNPLLRQVATAMGNIGYRGDLLVRDCEYADVTGNRYQVGRVDLAGFAQTPRSYRNACIGVVVSNGTSGAAHIAQHKALGAPLFFEIVDGRVDRWKVTEKGAPELKQQIQPEEIHNVFQRHEEEWKPDRIFRAKVIGDIEEGRQLDFFDVGLLPLLEGMIHEKLDQLLREVLKKITDTYQQYNRGEPNFVDIYRLVFRLIVAKVMRDRNYRGGWDAADAETILNSVEKYYRLRSGEILPGARHREDVFNVAWKVISNAFHFQNLSVDDLAYSYENTLVTAETRKTFGTHSTPPRVAEYIVRKLPLDKLPEQGRRVLEPCAGHAGFLIAAMRRLRELLGEEKTGSERHRYLVRRLVGIEIDPFAVEVCWSRLVLADYPHPNGWQLHEADVFKGDTLNKELKKSQVVLCNPPFEDFNARERAYYNNPEMLVQKPAELLRRVLAEPPELLGLVLPRVFESGAAYRRFHRQLAETYSNVELVALPEVFNYSEAATMVVIASARRDHHAQVAVTCRKVNDGTELDEFLYQGAEPPPTKAAFSVDEYLRPNFSLWVPPLSRIWSYLQDQQQLRKVADIHRGLMWVSSTDESGKHRRDYVSEEPKEGYVKGFARVQDHLMQYSLRGPKYLSLRPEDQYDNAYKHAWGAPKVVCNEHRLRRSPWRVGAVADPTGMAFSARFIALWPSKEISIYALAALLNSPVANAFFYAKEAGSVNRLVTLKSLPLPPLEYLRVGGNIDLISRDLHQQISRNQLVKAKSTLLRLDAEILLTYDLPPILERELLDTFQGVERPVPFDFKGYYPPGLEAYIPLHELISEDFNEARADRLLERLVFVNDPELSRALALRRGESVDESLPS